MKFIKLIFFPQQLMLKYTTIQTPSLLITLLSQLSRAYKGGKARQSENRAGSNTHFP